MTLEEKIGQMTQAEQDALKDVNDIQKYFLGSLLSGGSSDPKAGNSLEAWTDMYDGYQSHALKTRLAIPILYGADAVHGHNNVLGAVIFPHNIGLGCTRNPGWLKAPRASPRKKCAPPASIGRLLPASQFLVMNVGAEPMKDLAKRRNWRAL